MPDFAKIKASTVEAAAIAQQMVDAMSRFQEGKDRFVTYSTAQKTALRTRYTDSLAALKAVVTDIETELG